MNEEEFNRYLVNDCEIRKGYLIQKPYLGNAIDEHNAVIRELNHRRGYKFPEISKDFESVYRLDENHLVTKTKVIEIEVK